MPQAEPVPKGAPASRPASRWVAARAIARRWSARGQRSQAHRKRGLTQALVLLFEDVIKSEPNAVLGHTRRRGTGTPRPGGTWGGHLFAGALQRLSACDVSAANRPTLPRCRRCKRAPAACASSHTTALPRSHPRRSDAGGGGARRSQAAFLPWSHSRTSSRETRGCRKTGASSRPHAEAWGMGDVALGRGGEIITHAGVAMASPAEPG